MRFLIKKLQITFLFLCIYPVLLSNTIFAQQSQNELLKNFSASSLNVFKLTEPKNINSTKFIYLNLIQKLNKNTVFISLNDSMMSFYGNQSAETLKGFILSFNSTTALVSLTVEK